MEGMTLDASAEACVAASPQSTWPECDLEQVQKCPVCGGADRRPLYGDLTDVVYRCAPGRWNIYQCDECTAAYLDPRPTAASVARAYDQFYTHAQVEKGESAQSPLKRLKTALRNGYMNARVGADLRPAIAAGTWIVPLVHEKKREFDFAARGLSHSSRGAKCVLDVGCGDGFFLRLASSLGWKTHGVEPDVVAANAAREWGCDVIVGSFEQASLPGGHFDLITMCHVIEHLIDPMASVRKAIALLRPGGHLWMATPNLESAAHARFGKNWIGLDAPRHMVLFNAKSISRLLSAAAPGCKFEFLPGRSALGDFMLSWKVANGLLPFQSSSLPLPREIRYAAAIADKASRSTATLEQEIVILVTKPERVG
jgi:2-polyprenyl-3-methyl-5-hydroxy-6-metoxy-1,4-benzoquinol methylase